MNTLLTLLESSLERLRQCAQRHPRRFNAALLSVLLMGGGAYAVAAAVETLGPDATQLPVQQVSVTLTPPLAQEPVASPEPHHYSLYRSDLSRSSDTADTLLRRMGIDDRAAADFMRRDTLVQRHLLGRAGRNLSSEASDDNRLVKMVARWSAPEDDGSFKRLVLEKSGDTFKSRIETQALTASVRMGSGTIDSSLFASMDEAGLPDAVGVQIAEIFSGDIDFHRELRKGDRYSVVYEVLEGDGEALRTGRVLSAEFVNAGKVYQAVWFQDPSNNAAQPLAANPSRPQERGAYYSLDGKSLKRAYLASPLAFSRVTSGFKMRFHPIMQTWRAHLGVDYAAPVGTAVRSVGDGVVDFAGVQSGYGNVVFVRHRNNNVTVYAHLSRIFVRVGQRVEQGQSIAASGATGWATGPHLHFEFRVNGQQQNPLTIARSSESLPLSAAARPAFARVAGAARQQLAAAAQLVAAR